MFTYTFSWFCNLIFSLSYNIILSSSLFVLASQNLRRLKKSFRLLYLVKRDNDRGDRMDKKKMIEKREKVSGNLFYFRMDDTVAQWPFRRVDICAS